MRQVPLAMELFSTHIGEWPSHLMHYQITFKELFPIVLAVEIWGSHLRNKCITLHSDNFAVVHIINKQSSEDSDIMILVRRFVLACMRFNLLVRGAHIPGVLKTLTDTSLSPSSRRHGPGANRSTPTHSADAIDHNMLSLLIASIKPSSKAVYRKAYSNYRHFHTYSIPIGQFSLLIVCELQSLSLIESFKATRALQSKHILLDSTISIKF